ncbi:MAG TPA: hypothetical protein VK465_00650 [Fibrobacteria bacterium]|nr:hypothetical protein [Fibrobacteria bacterium]
MTRLSTISTPWQLSAVRACIGRGVAVHTMDHAKRMEEGGGSP